MAEQAVAKYRLRFCDYENFLQTQTTERIFRGAAALCGDYRLGITGG